MQRPHVRDVAHVALEEGEPAGHVDGLQRQHAAGAQHLAGPLQETHQVVRLEVLHDLRREDAAEALVLEPLQVRQGVALARVEPALPAFLDHLVVDVEAAGAHALLAQQVEELAAPAPDVEHVLLAREQRQVVLQPLPDHGGRPAELILEPDVLERLDAARRERVCRRRRVGRAGSPVGTARRAVRQRPPRRQVTASGCQAEPEPLTDR